MVSLHKGSRGVEVKHWQDFLIAQGHLHKRHVLSRLVFDSDTEAATIKFQKKHGLTETGELDEKTIKKAQELQFKPHDIGSQSGAAEYLLMLSAIDIVNKRYNAARAATFGTNSTHNGKDIPGQYQTIMILLASMFNANDAAMIAGIWAKESNFKIRPYGDAGPAQLTSWWLQTYPELIKGDAYGSWKGRICDPEFSKSSQPSCKDGSEFDGNVMDNLITLGNIVRFSRNRYKKESQIPHNYNSGDNAKGYQDEVMGLLEKYKSFFKSLLDGTP